MLRLTWRSNPWIDCSTFTNRKLAQGDPDHRWHQEQVCSTTTPARLYRQSGGSAHYQMPRVDAYLAYRCQCSHEESIGCSGAEYGDSIYSALPDTIRPRKSRIGLG